jgi:hypothetical protein
VTRALLLGALASACALPARAQLTLEVRGGAAIGAYEATEAGRQDVPGPSFGATVGYAFTPRLEAFAGYSRDAFGCEEGFCAGVDPTFTRSGAEAGLRVQLPARLWVRAGLAAHKLSVSSGAPGGDRDSGPAAGVRLGAGFGIPLGPRLSVTPGIEYSRFTTDLDEGSHGVGVVVGSVGLRVRF